MVSLESNYDVITISFFAICIFADVGRDEEQPCSCGVQPRKMEIWYTDPKA